MGGSQETQGPKNIRFLFHVGKTTFSLTFLNETVKLFSQIFLKLFSLKQIRSQKKYKYLKPNKVLRKLKIGSYNWKCQLIFYIFSLINVPYNIFHYRMLLNCSKKCHTFKYTNPHPAGEALQLVPQRRKSSGIAAIIVFQISLGLHTKDHKEFYSSDSRNLEVD